MTDTRLRYDLYCVEWDVKLYYTNGQTQVCGILLRCRAVVCLVTLRPSPPHPTPPLQDLSRGPSRDPLRDY